MQPLAVVPIHAGQPEAFLPEQLRLLLAVRDHIQVVPMLLQQDRDGPSNAAGADQNDFHVPLLLYRFTAFSIPQSRRAFARRRLLLAIYA